MKNILILIILLTIKYSLSQDIKSNAPDFSGVDLNNNTIQLKNLKGKVILLDFWASWCVPCKKSIPYLIDYFSNNTDTNFIILGVNVDTDNESLNNFLNKLGLNFSFPVIMDKENKIISKYNVEAMPTTILIDKKGVIRYKYTGFTDDSKKEYSLLIEKLLKE